MTKIEELKIDIENIESTVESHEWEISDTQVELSMQEEKITEKESEIETYEADKDDEDIWELFKAEMCESIEEIHVIGVYISAEQLFDIAHDRDEIMINEEFSAWANSKQSDSSYLFPAQEEMNEEIEELDDEKDTIETRLRDLEIELLDVRDELKEAREDLVQAQADAE